MAEKVVITPKFCAEGLGFTAALWAKLELEIQFLKIVSYST